MEMRTGTPVATKQANLFEAKETFGTSQMDLPLEFRIAGVPEGNGGLIINVSENTLLIYSRESMPVGYIFKLRIFSAAYKFTQFEVLAKILSRREDTKDVFGGYVYGLEILDFMATRPTQTLKFKSATQNK
jgi:hypothetical protein